MKLDAEHLDHWCRPRCRATTASRSCRRRRRPPRCCRRPASAPASGSPSTRGRRPARRATAAVPGSRSGPTRRRRRARRRGAPTRGHRRRAGGRWPRRAFARGSARSRRTGCPREAAEARRIAARIEVDAVDQARVHHRRADAEVKEGGDADAVDEEPRVAGRRAADEEVRQAAQQRSDAGHRLDGAEGVAEGAGHLLHLAGGHLLSSGLAAHAADADLLDGRRGRRGRSG